MGSRPSHFTLTGPGPLRILSLTELLAMPEPTWLIENVLPDEALSAMYAAPESFKSFIAIDMGMCVATGRPWLGHKVEKGFVLYIGAEGGSGLAKRALAWLLEHQMDAKDIDIGFLVESLPVYAESDEMVVLMDRIRNEIGRRPALIIIDTLARCFDGDENQQEDMGRFIAGADTLKKEFNCSVMIIHHTRLGGDRERGNTALRGAVDTMLYIERENQEYQAQIVCSKQKDAEHFETLWVDICPVEGVNSCVVRPGRAAETKRERESAILDVLKTVGPCHWDDWVSACDLDPDENKRKSQFMRAFSPLKERKLVKKDQKTGKWSATS